MHRTIRSLVLLSALATAVLAGRAQAQITPGPVPAPTPWPLGGSIPQIVANDGTTQLQYQPCQPVVHDANGNLVFIGFCLQVIQFLQPGDVGVMYWPQVFTTGGPVPPGVYDVGGVRYDVGATDAALVPLGRPFIGATRSIFLTAPSQPNAPYVLAASGSSTFGVPLGCGRTFPLDFDALTLQSLTATNVFHDFIGTLDVAGQAYIPSISVPVQPSLAGLQFELAFLTVDMTAPCAVGVISDAVSTTIL